MMEVSFCVPTYNSANYLPDAVHSIMRQSLEDFEIVIVDNASNDDTESVVRGLGNPRIRYFKNDFNVGSRENFNRTLERAHGKYIKFLCADDVLRDGVVLKQRDILRNRADVALVASDMLVTDSQLCVKELVRFFPGYRDGRRLVLASLTALSNYIGGPSGIMFRRADANGLKFDPAYRWVADLKFEAQLLLKGSYFNIDEPGFLYRRHNYTDTATSCPPVIRVPEFMRLAEEFGCWNPISLALAIRNDSISNKKQFLTDIARACNPQRIKEAISIIGDIILVGHRLKPTPVAALQSRDLYRCSEH